MKMPFTPGPWSAELVGSTGHPENPEDLYEITNGHTRIAEFVSERDVRLIACAPALYEQLHKLVYEGFRDNEDEAEALLKRISGEGL